MLLLTGGSTLTMGRGDCTFLDFKYVVVCVMIAGGGGLIFSVGGDLLCGLGEYTDSYILGIGMGSGRDNCGPRAMSIDVYLGVVSVCYPLLAWVLSSS